MGSWFSKKENKLEDSQAIVQSADSPIIQINWATFSTGLSSFAIILVLLLMLAICYKKNKRSNRRARRSELHDILHSVHRGAPANSAPPPSRGGYPAFPPAFPGAYPGFPMQMATMAPMVTYPGPSPSTSTAVVPAGQMLQMLQRPGAPITYGAHNAPRRTGFPGVNSTVTRRDQLRAKYGTSANRNRLSAPLPAIIALPGPGQQTDEPTQAERTDIKAITYVPSFETIQSEAPIVPLGRAKSMANIYPGSFPTDTIPRLYKARSTFFQAA